MASSERRNTNYSRRQFCDACLQRKREEHIERTGRTKRIARNLNGTGLTRMEAAKKTGVSYTAFCRAAADLGLQDWRHVPRNNARLAFRCEQIRALYGLQFTRRQAAKTLNMSYNTFNCVARRLGLRDWSISPEDAEIKARMEAGKRRAEHIMAGFTDGERDFYRLLRRKEYDIDEAAEYVLRERIRMSHSESAS